MFQQDDDAIRRHLGARIETLRKARGLTQREVGERADLSQKYVSQLERGNGSPSWTALRGLAHRGFEIKLASLVFGIDEDIDTELRDLNDIVAGRSLEARRILLRSIALAVRAGEIETRMVNASTDLHGGLRTPGKPRATR
jgi:transcriptional regulator with XRE-family HTH domain